MNSVYTNCPVYTTKRFIIRGVRLGDAEDLLCCYADPKAVELFNCDNCTSDFFYKTLEEMQDCIRFWLVEYGKKRYVRFSVVDQASGKAIGTIEIFNKGDYAHLRNVGILRLDLASPYETEDVLDELLHMAIENFYEAFGLENIMTKAVPQALARRKALTANHFFFVERPTVMPYSDYYIRNIVTPAKLAENIGYCGLVCGFCHEADSCEGCKNLSNCCGRRLRAEGCFQYNCCQEKRINGCWECETAPCDQDMFSTGHDIRNRTFVRCAKEEGLLKLAEYVLKNQLNGIQYGWNKDYDNLGSAEAVLDLLHHGVHSPYAKQS